MLNKIPKVFRNFYLIAGLLFLIWMLFIDSADIFSHASLRVKLKEMKDQKSYYEEKIEEVEADREALLNDEELLEKFAREKYYMKKPNEDVFVVVDKED